jgi:hypothetical protein
MTKQRHIESAYKPRATPLALAFDEMPANLLAFDRSARRKDVDGRLHVDSSNISKATVNPYFGHEIPNWQTLGLDGEKIYQLYRDPEELKRAADSFNNIPLLSKHVPVSPEDHQPDLVVGSTGTDCVFEFPYLKNSLVVWESVAIAGIETRDQCELSCSYRYTPVMEAGTFEGVAYDGRMTNIIGNHVALVEVGRAGADVVVADSKPLNLQGTFTMTRKEKLILAHAAALKVAMDAGISKKDLARILASDAETVIKEEEDKEKAKAKVADDEDEQREGESDAEYEARMKAKKEKAASDEEDDKAKAFEKSDKDKKDDKAAMDAAIAAAEASAVKRMQAIHAAELDVQPVIGSVVAQDSAAGVYKLALDHLGVNTKDVHPSAFKALFDLSKGKKAAPVANDSGLSASGDFKKDFPNAVIPKRG